MVAPTPIGTVFGLDGANFYSAPILARDKSFPITNMRPYQPMNEVAMNMPSFMAWWEDDMIAPTITGQTVTIDITTLDASDDCDSAVVRSTATTCDFITPNMKHVSFKTDPLEIKELMRPLATFQRNIAPDILGNQVFDSNGNFRKGTPYRQNVLRTALAAICQAAEWTWTKHAFNGDYSNTHQVDGLYNQLDNGWGAGSVDCGPANNEAQVINWYYLTDAAAVDENDVSGFGKPDDTTIAGRTVTIHGDSKDVPEGLTFAQFLEEFWIDYVETLYTSRYGEVEWEMHVAPGEKYRIRDMVTCMQPCGNDSNFDDEVRGRWQGLHRSNIMKLAPSGKEFAIQQSTELAQGVNYFGPRRIGADYTYALAFQPINDFFSQALLGHNLYGMQDGMTRHEDPFIWKDQTFIANEFESMAFKFDWTKISQKCMQAGMQYQYGLLAVQRHLWLKVIQMSAERTFITVPGDTVSEI